MGSKAGEGSVRHGPPAWLALLVLGAACQHTSSHLPPVSPAGGPTPPIEVVAERGYFRIEADGTKTYAYDLRYRVLSDVGVKAWRTLEASWVPAYQARPAVEARVQTADGKEHVLDPASVTTERLDGERVPTRRLEAELPGLAVGALVDQRIVIRDVRPRLGSGASGRFRFGQRVPVGRSEVVLDVPVDLPVTVDVRGVELRPEVKEAGDRRIIRYRLDDLEPLGPVDKHLPSDVPRHPYVAFTTAADWSSVVQPLVARFDACIRGSEVGSILEDLPPQALRAEVLMAAVKRVRSLVTASEARFRLDAFPPRHPNETLARGEGSAADVAALLVALLRARGLDAHLALVRAGPGEDIRPTVPTAQGFDRTLVRVGTSAPVWIDPGAAFLPPGTLPSALQGRWSLVLAADTAGPERSPRDAAIDNRYWERRVIELPSAGPARVLETTRVTGAIGGQMRARLGTASELRSSLEAYVGRTYGAARLGRHSTSNPSDLERPFEVQLEALEADAGAVDVTNGLVKLRTAVLFGWLPPLIRDAALAESKEPTERDDELRQIAAVLVERRRAPFELPEPYVAEILVEVRPPPGFVVDRKPRDRDLQLGPARFSTRFFVQDGAVVGRLRFETGPPRWEAEDLRAVVRGLRTLWAEPIIRIPLVHRGAQALQQGDIDLGIRSFADIAAARADSAADQARLALALVEIGLGDAARKVAEEAVALEPTSVMARYVLGRVLSHDLVGRLYAPGFDREGAMSALRLVKALDPGHVRARAELAVLRSTDDRGLRYSEAAVVEAAVAEYRSLRDDTGVRAFDDDLIEALLVGERFEEVLIEARDARRSLRRDAHILAATVALRGDLDEVDEVIAALGIPDKVLGLVETAAATALARIGRYDSARALLERMRRGDRLEGPLAKQAARIGAIRPLKSLLRPEGDPVRVVQDLLSEALAGRASSPKVRRLLSRRHGAEPLEAEALRLTHTFAEMSRAAERAKVPPSVLRDAIMSSTEFAVEGEPEVGFRVRALLEGRRPTWWFLRSEPSADGDASPLRMVGAGTTPSALGSVALEALSQGQAAVAEQWLVWADELFERARPPGPLDDPFAELPYTRLRRTEPKRQRAAALALATLGTRGDDVLGRLSEAARRAAPGLRDSLEHARLLGLMRRERFKEALEVVEPLVRRHPQSRALLDLCLANLVELERWAPAERLVRRWLERTPDDVGALGQLASLETARGNFARAEAILERLAEEGPKESSVVYNNLAWVALFRGEVGPEAFRLALKANALSRGRSPAELHTLAALHAERGDTEETVKLVRRRLELREADAPGNEDYYLFGRVMEHLGLWRLAREAYQRVEKDEGDRADSTHALAQRRLQGLVKRSAI